MLRVDSRTDRLEIFSVSIFDSSILIDVFPNLEDVIAESTVQLVMNPFTGYATNNYGMIRDYIDLSLVSSIGLKLVWQME